MPSGLRLSPADPRRAAIETLACIAGVTAVVVALDALFRPHLDPRYVAFYAQPLIPRIYWECAASAWEEILYRGILMTAIAYLVTRWRGRVAPWSWVAIIVLTQLANAWRPVLAEPVYGSLRYLAVGCVWGWLYLRQGWLSALIGHSATHLVLDPALLVALS